MKTLSINKMLLLKIFGFLILFQTTLFSENIYHVSNSDSTSVNSQVVNSSVSKDGGEVETVALDSFGGTGVVLMILFTSLLGVFFVRDEFSGIID